MNKKLKSDVPMGQRRRIKGKQPPGKKTPSGKPRKKSAQAPPTDDLEEPINELSPPETVTPDPTPSECFSKPTAGLQAAAAAATHRTKVRQLMTPLTRRTRAKHHASWPGAFAANQATEHERRHYRSMDCLMSVLGCIRSSSLG